MKKFIIIIICLILSLCRCFANDYTFIEEVAGSIGQYIVTPEFLIEVWDYDTHKSSCWIPGDKLIVTPRGYLINIDRHEQVRMVDIELRKNYNSTGLYDDIDREVEEENR